MAINLSHLNKLLKKSSTRVLPPGFYSAVIQEASVEESKNGNPQIVYKLEVEVDTQTGLQKVVIYKFTQLAEPMFDFFIREMELLRVIVPDMSELEEVLSSLPGTVVEIEVDYNPGYGYPVPKFLSVLCKPNGNYGYIF